MHHSNIVTERTTQNSSVLMWSLGKKEQACLCISAQWTSREENYNQFPCVISEHVNARAWTLKKK